MIALIVIGALIIVVGFAWILWPRDGESDGDGAEVLGAIIKGIGIILLICMGPVGWIILLLICINQNTSSGSSYSYSSTYKSHNDNCLECHKTYRRNSDSIENYFCSIECELAHYEYWSA